MRKFFGAATAVGLLGCLPGIALAQSEVVVWVAGEPGQATVYDELAEAFNASQSDRDDYDRQEFVRPVQSRSRASVVCG